MVIRLIVVLLVFAAVICFAGGRALTAYDNYQAERAEEKAAEESLREVEKAEASKEESIAKAQAIEESREESVRESQSIEESLAAATAEKKYTHEYEVVHTDITWNDAQTAAEAKGGHLATITSSEEYKKVLSVLDSHIRSSGDTIVAVWLGANNLSDGSYTWLTGEKFEYTHWAEGEPNNENGQEHYLLMYKVKGKWVWNDSPDAISEYYPDKIAYIIEKDYEME